MYKTSTLIKRLLYNVIFIYFFVGISEMRNKYYIIIVITHHTFFNYILFFDKFKEF